jgi:hypothetical protein
MELHRQASSRRQLVDGLAVLHLTGEPAAIAEAFASREKLVVGHEGLVLEVEGEGLCRHAGFLVRQHRFLSVYVGSFGKVEGRRPTRRRPPVYSARGVDALVTLTNDWVGDFPSPWLVSPARLAEAPMRR